MAESRPAGSDVTDGGRKRKGLGRIKPDGSWFFDKTFWSYSAMAILWCAFLIVATDVLPMSRMVSGSQLYTNTFAVRLRGPDGGGHVEETLAHQVAKRAGLGFQNVGKVHILS